MVSGGKSPKIVPKVEGLQIEGMNQIGLAGLGIGSIVREYTGAEPGIVLRTEPGAGALLGRDQPVTVVVTGPAPTVEVPSVEALREADAVSKMQEAGLDVTVRPWQVPTGAPEVGRVIPSGHSACGQGPTQFQGGVVGRGRPTTADHRPAGNVDRYRADGGDHRAHVDDGDRFHQHLQLDNNRPWGEASGSSAASRFGSPVGERTGEPQVLVIRAQRFKKFANMSWPEVVRINSG